MKFDSITPNIRYIQTDEAFITGIHSTSIRSLHNELVHPLHACVCAGLLKLDTLTTGATEWPDHVKVIREGHSVIEPAILCLLSYILPPVLAL